MKRRLTEKEQVEAERLARKLSDVTEKLNNYIDSRSLSENEDMPAEGEEAIEYDENGEPIEYDENGEVIRKVDVPTVVSGALAQSVEQFYESIYLINDGVYANADRWMIAGQPPITSIGNPKNLEDYDIVFKDTRIIEYFRENGIGNTNQTGQTYIINYMKDLVRPSGIIGDTHTTEKTIYYGDVVKAGVEEFIRLLEEGGIVVGKHRILTNQGGAVS